MKFVKACSFVNLAILLCCANLALADTGTLQVQSVAISGNHRVDQAAIVAQLKATSGSVTQDAIDQDLKAIYRTGFFDQVTVSTTAGPKGVQLRYEVVEKPLVRKIFIQGNKEIKESELREVIKLGGDRFLDRAKIDAIMRSSVLYYQTQGFYDATFDYSAVPVADNQVDLTFTVAEGQKYKIRHIVVNGLKEVDDSDVLSVMQTKRYKWWSSWLLGTGRLNPDMLENDRGLVRQFFFDHGYLDVSISEPRIEKKDGAIELVWDINEGRQYKIDSINASGDLVDGSVEKTLDGVESKVGDVFSASQIREDSFKVSEKYTDTGYAFANVVPNTQVNRESATVGLDFAVSKGGPVTVGRINIHGNQKTYDNVIRRELRVQEEETFSSSKVKRSQELLERLGFFEEVNITSEPSKEKDRVDLNVNVREASTGSFSVGAGFSSSDGPLFNARLSENNILGSGRSASINADLGTRRDNLVLSLNDNRINDSFVSGGIDLLRSDREYSDFDRRLTGGSLELGYPLDKVFGEWAEDLSASMQYQYLGIDISNVDLENAAQLVIDSAGTSTSSSVTPKIIRNTINNPLNPSKGSRQVVSFEYAGPGGNEEYYLFEARNQWYQPLLKTGFGDFVFSWRTTFGYGESQNDDPFPLFKRYFPGGINSVRGFKNRTLGPKDARGNEYGGSKEFVNNFELIFPLINSAGLKGVAFYDLGQAFDDHERVDFGDLRKAYGYGIRWTSPLGPIRVEFGFPIDRRDGESSMVTLFSFGAPL
ncbi:MAG: outer membrane protein assembly factor BamA [Oligoflexia bacterium]|nr:outer membrane protein assembly factor BamA [Oligoflexia bacterium]